MAFSCMLCVVREDFFRLSQVALLQSTEYCVEGQTRTISKKKLKNVVDVPEVIKGAHTNTQHKHVIQSLSDSKFH